MSYCRCGSDSDVYMYSSYFDGKYTIHLSNGSEVTPGKTFIVKTAQEALDFLEQLKKDGVKVPPYTLIRLKKKLSGKMNNEIEMPAKRMKIKVLPLESWMLRDKFADKLLGTKNYPTTEKVFNRNGIYLKGKTCWIEVNGTAYRYNAEAFKSTLKLLNAEQYNDKQINALVCICTQKLATKQQKELLFTINAAKQIKNTYRRSLITFNRRIRYKE